MSRDELWDCPEEFLETDEEYRRRLALPLCDICGAPFNPKGKRLPSCCKGECSRAIEQRREKEMKRKQWEYEARKAALKPTPDFLTSLKGVKLGDL